MQASSWRKVLVFVSLSLLIFPPNADAKKLEETSSFDVKPSGKIAHQKIVLVSEENYYTN